MQNRFRSIVAWGGICSMVIIVFNTAGIQLSDLTSWSILGSKLLEIIKNPYTVGAIIFSIVSHFNNPTNPDMM